MSALPIRCVLIKLGGAYFTDKLIAGKIHHERIATFCRDLANVIECDMRPSGLAVILVSGGGSVGHHAAQAYKVQQGSDNCDLTNVFRMSEAMLVMKANLCREFSALGLSTFPFQEAALAFVQQSGEIALNWRNLIHCLRLGLLPVLSGGLVFHQKFGVCALNGDRLMSQLTCLPGLAVERAVFLSGEDGLLDPDARTVPMLLPKDRVFAKSLVRRFDNAGVDVTGGMEAKLDCCFDMAERGVRACILSGASLSARSLGDVLLGRSSRGTWFLPEPAAARH